jgi:serine/threonine-protein kinase RsbT
MNKKTYFIKPNDYDLAGYASSDVKRILRNLKYDRHFIKRVCSASYEAEINIVIHSNGGIMEFIFDENQILLNFIDYGPGIENIEDAMTEGFSTASDQNRQNGFGAGMGLPNIKRQADDMHIVSSREGTILNLAFVIPQVTYEN